MVEAEVQHILLQPVQVEVVQQPATQIQIIAVLLIIAHLLAVEALHQVAVHPQEEAAQVVVAHVVPEVVAEDVGNTLNELQRHKRLFAN